MRITDLDMQRRWTSMEKDAVTVPHSDSSEVYIYIYRERERVLFLHIQCLLCTYSNRQKSFPFLFHRILKCRFTLSNLKSILLSVNHCNCNERVKKLV